MQCTLVVEPVSLAENSCFDENRKARSRTQDRTMRRREFITLLGGLAVGGTALAAHAQQQEQQRIGFLTGLSADDAEGAAHLAAFRQGLTELGWTVGRNLTMDYRAAGRDPDRYGRYAEELVALR